MQMQSSSVNMVAENFKVVKFDDIRKKLKRLLIIDDDSAVLSTFSFMFDSNKDELEVVLVDSLKAAIDEYNKQKFDVIILDHHLPKGSGIIFIRQTNAKNVFYFSGGIIAPGSVWPFKDNIINIFQKPFADKIYKAVLEHLDLKCKPYKIATTTEKERSQSSFKGDRQYQRDFKRMFGKNQQEYIKGENGAKINLAKTLLREGMTILAVSNVLKYPYRRNFQAFFKLKTGITPGEYRKAHINEE